MKSPYWHITTLTTSENEPEMDSNSLVYSELKSQLASIHEQIIDTILEYDQIRLQTNRQLQHRYVISIGCWEQQRLFEDIATRKSKRRFELANSHINRGMSVDMACIDNQLERELKEWYEKLEKQIQKYCDSIAEREGCKLMNSSETKELSRLYKTLMKRLHPDLNPHLGAKERELFHVAQFAYENGSLDVLQSLEIATKHLQEADMVSLATSAKESTYLEAELTIAQRVLQDHGKKLEDLKNSFPYVLKDKLYDSEWLDKTINKIKQEIERSKRVRQYYEEKLEVALNQLGAS